MFAIEFATRWIIQRILIAVVVFEKMVLKVRAKVSRIIAVTHQQIFTNIPITRLSTTILHTQGNILYKIYYKISHTENFYISSRYWENRLQSQSNSFCKYFNNVALYDYCFYKGKCSL